MMIMMTSAAIQRLTLFCFAGSVNVAMGNLRYLTASRVAMAMKMLLMENRYSAPAKYFRLPVASPKPAVHNGGMRAVAMATPEMTVPLSFRLISMIPAEPPNKAMNTSYIVGLVLVSNSVGFSSSSGDTRKYTVDARMLITTITIRFLNDFFRKDVSLVPRPYPIPNIGPMSGDMSMAPMITAIELVFRPTDATIMAKARM